jgi:hypothetical protein
VLVAVAAYPDEAALEVDVVPPQVDELAPPHAGTDQGVEDVVVDGAPGRLEELPDLVLGEEPETPLRSALELLRAGDGIRRRMATPVEDRGGRRSKIAAPSPYILWVLTMRSSPSLRAGAVRRASRVASWRPSGDSSRRWPRSRARTRG